VPFRRSLSRRSGVAAKADRAPLALSANSFSPGRPGNGSMSGAPRIFRRNQAPRLMVRFMRRQPHERQEIRLHPPQRCRSRPPLRRPHEGYRGAAPMAQQRSVRRDRRR
jgi:hypothetical protein